MPLHYANLDESTRSFMLSEIDLDLAHGKLHISQHLNELGKQNYVSLLRDAIEHHDDVWIAQQLLHRGYMADSAQGKEGPVDAPELLSEKVFNQYYIRGLCVRVLEEGMNHIEIYRGKPANRSRPDAEAMIGKRLNAKALLADLRESSSVNAALGLPSGQSSGLTIRMETIEGITKIAVSGFKSIAKDCAIDIRPLTILSGANSTGKSSIMQPLLMLKQTLEATYDPGPLLIEGPNVQFTSADQFLSKLTGEEISDRFQIEIETDESDSVRTIFGKGRSRIEPIKMSTKRKLGIGAAEHVTLEPEMSPDAIKSLVAQDPSLEIRGVNAVITSRCFLGLASHDGYKFFEYTENLESNIFSSIHLPGLRGNPERLYKLTSTGPRYPGTFENYIASIIHNWQETADERLDRLADVLCDLGLTGQVRTEKIGDVGIDIRVGRLPHRGTGETDTVSIADVGIGVSQVLPVLVALLVAEPGRLVYLEQPETHLHPRAQVALAQLLADAAKRGVRIVAETHSSLLLLAVQTLVAEGSLSPELVKLHWFTRGENGATEINTADLDDAGAYGNWPEDFDDVDLKAQSRYIKAAQSRLAEKP